MPLLSAIFSTFLEAIFPTAAAEREVLGMDAETALHALPRAKQFPIRDACSIFAYKDERVWRLIWTIKYKKSRRGAAIAGYALHRILGLYASVAPRLLVIPMPITRKRRRERGYNQCELIADEVERLELAQEHAGKDPNRGDRLTVIRDLLVRTRHTSRQTLKDRAKRLESAREIFAVRPDAVEKLKIERSGNTDGSGVAKMSGVADGAAQGDAALTDSLVIVIDDVVTTGSTILDAIQTLRRAGFTNVFGLSVAH